jgi:hypothetical protein
METIKNPIYQCAGRAGPGLGFWSHIEVQIATPVLSSRVPLPDSWRVLKTREDSDPIRLHFPAGAYRFAPDPVPEIRIGKKREEKRGKRSEAECFLSPAMRLAQQSYSQIVSSV